MTKKRSDGRKRRDQTRSAFPVESADLKAAVRKVEQARTALRQAEEAHRQEAHRHAEREAAEQTQPNKEVTVGHFLDGALALVRRFPVAGVIAAGTIGFLLGRSGRRR